MNFTTYIWLEILAVYSWYNENKCSTNILLSISAEYIITKDLLVESNRSLDCGSLTACLRDLDYFWYHPSGLITIDGLEFSKVYVSYIKINIWKQKRLSSDCFSFTTSWWLKHSGKKSRDKLWKLNIDDCKLQNVIYITF